jgi:UDP-2-acetamido-2-deoxy-ribo-hexuluronate aminotransferase
MKQIQMVDLASQYNKIKPEIDEAIQNVLAISAFINGPQVKHFEKALAEFNNSADFISCANGTDALQIAMMALNLKPGDEIIMPAFTYIATVEAAALLKIKPILVDVDAQTFNISPEKLEKAITKDTKAMVAVHLFGQCASMERILEIGKKHNLHIIEDAAQAIGSEFKFSDGKIKKAGSMGSIGTTSFFPSKNLGCYGDGGALYTNNKELGETIRMIANHGQKQKYYHDMIGINSRLDTLQAAILNVKLKNLDHYTAARQKAASVYDKAFAKHPQFNIPARNPDSTHVFHQYTLTIKNKRRDDLKIYLEAQGIPTMVYYPLPIHFQKAFSYLNYKPKDFPVSEALSESVLSLPMHTELEDDQLNYITEKVLDFFK